MAQRNGWDSGIEDVPMMRPEMFEILQICIVALSPRTDRRTQNGLLF